MGRAREARGHDSHLLALIPHAKRGKILDHLGFLPNAVCGLCADSLQCLLNMSNKEGAANGHGGSHPQRGTLA